MLQQLASASTIAGNASAAQMYMREADELRHWRHLLLRRAKSAGPARVASWVLGLILVAAAGGATSYAIANSDGGVDPRTIRAAVSTRVPVTFTVNGQTVTTTTTVTLPAYRTVTLPPTTVISTTTVTATVEATPPQ